MRTPTVPHHTHPDDLASGSSPEPAVPSSGARYFTPLDACMVGLLALLVGCHLVAARLAAGWTTSAITDALGLGYLLTLLLRRAWRPVIVRLLAVGLLAGILELFTDAEGESFAHSLVYPRHEPFLWASPAYMPFSWAIVLVEIGYLGWRVRGLLPLGWAMLLTGLWGAINIPFYEETAYYARWWHYHHTLGIGHTPLYVVVFEGLIAAALPLLLTHLPRASRWGTLLRGAALGAWIPWAALLSWLALGR